MKTHANIHRAVHRGHRKIPRAVALPVRKLNAHPEVPSMLLAGLLLWLLKAVLSNVWLEGVGGSGVWALFG